MLDLGLTLIVALIGGYFADKRKVPAGYMIGALFAVAIFIIIFGAANIPKNFRFWTQAATGTFLGAKFFEKDIHALKKVLFPGIVMTVLMISFSFILSFLMSHIFGMEYITAVFATSPGGLMDMSLIAYEFEANASQVALLQLIRLISVITFVPFFAKQCSLTSKRKEKTEVLLSKKEGKNEKGFFHILVSLFIGISAGGLGALLRVPAGAMSFSMLAVAFYNVKTERAYMPLPLRKIIQAVGGALIGSRVIMADIIGLQALLFPILIIIIGFSLMNVFVGFFLYRTSKFSLATSLLAAAPGGMADIAIMADDLGADPPQVAIMQFLRASSIVVIYPILIKLLFR